MIDKIPATETEIEQRKERLLKLKITSTQAGYILGIHGNTVAQHEQQGRIPAQGDRSQRYTVEDILGAPSYDNDHKKAYINDQLEKLDTIAKQQGTNRADLIRGLVQEYLEKNSDTFVWGVSK